MSKPIIETRGEWEYYHGRSASKVTREVQLKWLETEDGALIRVDSVVAIYPKKNVIPNSVCIQAGNCTYRFKAYPCDEAEKIMRHDIYSLKNIIRIGTWTSDVLKASDIGNEG